MNELKSYSFWISCVALLLAVLAFSLPSSITLMLEATRHTSYVKALKDEVSNNQVQARTTIEQIDHYGKVQLAPSYSTRAYDAIMGEGLLIVIDSKSTDELFKMYTRIDEWKETSAIIDSQTDEFIRNNIYKIHAGSIVKDSELIQDGLNTKYFAESFGSIFFWLSISTVILLCFLAVGFIRLFIFDKSKKGLATMQNRTPADKRITTNK